MQSLKQHQSTHRQVPSRIIEGTEVRVELLRVVYQAAGQARGGKGKPSQPRAESHLSSGAGRQSAILFIAPVFEFQIYSSL